MNTIRFLLPLFLCFKLCLANEFEPTEREQELFDLINARRTQVNLPPMIFCPVILEGSREWAEKLHRERRLYHWHGGRENCGRGYQTPRAMFYGWRSSAGHNALLHSRSAVHAAIGEHENYWVLRVAVSLEDYQTRANKNTMTKSKQIVYLVHYDSLDTDNFKVFTTRDGAEKAIKKYIKESDCPDDWESYDNGDSWMSPDPYTWLSLIELEVQD